jgi:hypothetical protein
MPNHTTYSGAVFVLAEKLLNAKAKNAVLEAIKDVNAAGENLGAYIQMALTTYNGTLSTSPARAFVVELLGNCDQTERVDQVNTHQDAADFGKMPADLAKNLVHCLINGQRDMQPSVQIEDYLEDEAAADAV